MWKNYLKTAWRNIWRNKYFSFITITGFAASMSLALLVILLIKDQYSFDRFHEDSDRIYRINTTALRTDGNNEPYASSPLPLAVALRDNYVFAESVVSIATALRADATTDNTVVGISGFFATPSFLQVFNFPLAEGDAGTALSAPNGIVLTKQTAEKLFGTHEAMGKTISLGRLGTYTVKGVLKALPGKTHFEFEVLAPMSAMSALEKEGVLGPSLDDWRNYYNGYLYVKLKPGVSKSKLDAALVQLSTTPYKNLQLETRDKGYSFVAQPLDDITPGPGYSNQMGRAMPDTITYFLMALVTVILLMAGINYTSLMVAKALKRAREIGVRKVVGATRKQVFFQFLGESVLFSLASLVAAYLLLQIIKPLFLHLQIASEFDIDLGENLILYFAFIGFAIFIGLLAGIFPATYLSGFLPVTIFKAPSGTRSGGRINLRKVLTVAQFSFSLVFLVGVVVIYQQVSFMIKADYGINDKNLINLRLQQNDYQQLANQIAAIPGVIRVGAVSHSLGTFADGSGDYRRTLTSDAMVIRDFSVNNQYLENLGIQLAAGQTFTTNISNGNETEVLINEKAMQNFGYKYATDALNQTIYSGDSTPLRIAGVVRNFNFRPLNYEIGPLVLRNRPQDYSILNIAISPGSKSKVLSAIETKWKQTDPNHLIQMSMMDDELKAVYDSAGFTDILKILSYIAFLAVIIACMGLLGMVMYSMELKVKEIGVRKVMGASVSHVTYLLSRSFALLILIGICIGLPVAYLLSNFFLETFAYRISNLWLLMSGGTALLVLIGLITICSQTISAARANPISSLRTE